MFCSLLMRRTWSDWSTLSKGESIKPVKLRVLVYNRKLPNFFWVSVDYDSFTNTHMKMVQMVVVVRQNVCGVPVHILCRADHTTPLLYPSYSTRLTLSPYSVTVISEHLGTPFHPVLLPFKGPRILFRESSLLPRSPTSSIKNRSYNLILYRNL